MLSVQKAIEILEKLEKIKTNNEKLHVLEDELFKYYEDVKKEVLENLKSNINYYD